MFYFPSGKSIILGRTYRESFPIFFHDPLNPRSWSKANKKIGRKPENPPYFMVFMVTTCNNDSFLWIFWFPLSKSKISQILRILHSFADPGESASIHCASRCRVVAWGESVAAQPIYIYNKKIYMYTYIHIFTLCSSIIYIYIHMYIMYVYTHNSILVVYL